MYRSALVRTLALALLTSCGEGEATAPLPPIDTYQGFASALRIRACEKLARCEWQYSAEERIVVTREMCLERWNTDGRFALALARGTGAYDRAAAEACLGTADALCISGDAPECSRVVVGTVPLGGGCSESLECESHLCSASPGTCGMCIATVPAGHACMLAGTPCVPGSQCTAGACTPYPTTELHQVGAGESCGNRGMRADVCAPDLYCNDGRCESRRSSGAECDPAFDQCAYGTICTPSADHEARCVRAHETSSEGAECGARPDGSFTYCDPNAGLGCGTSGLCERVVSDGATHAGCLRMSHCDSNLCLFGSFDSGNCAATGLADGASCTAYVECASGFCFGQKCGAATPCP